MKKIKLCILFLLIFICSFSEVITGRVLYVSDGDTLTMDVEGQKEKIRFYGIDAPETSQSGGLESKEFVLKRVRNKDIEVEVTDVDRYNRKIGKIYYDNGVYLNEKIIRNGHAWWYQQYARRDMDLKDAEEYARSNKLGLWAKASPVAPWEWRRGVRSSKSTSQIEGTENLVYVTKFGKKYHREGCRYLKSVADSYTREEAEGRGYTACSQFR